MTPELIVATRNKGKLREIRGLLNDLAVEVSSLADYQDLPEIVEDGKTFRQNAVKKAMTIAQATGRLTMGEDSGLEVLALDRRPGVYSARYSGPNADDAKNNAKLLRELKGIPLSHRQARYRSFIALADGSGLIAVVSGQCQGLIAERLRGHNGFGYDPLFLIPRFQKTFGELDPDVKAGISHRARALKKLRARLQDILQKKSA